MSLNIQDQFVIDSGTNLYENRISLTRSESAQIDNLLPGIIKIIEDNFFPENSDHIKYAGKISYESPDRKIGQVQVYVSNDSDTANGHYDRSDNTIYIQVKPFRKYFNAENKGKLKVSAFLGGNKNVGLENLRKTLVHELIHAKDPNLNNNPNSIKNYNPSDPVSLYKSWIEFKTMTGQFFESIDNGVDIMIHNWRTTGFNRAEYNQTSKALVDILNVFSGKSFAFQPGTHDFIQKVNRNALQKVFNFVNGVLGKPFKVESQEQSSLVVYKSYLTAIRKYNPESWNLFLKDLYKTIDKAKDRINKEISIGNIKAEPLKLNETYMSLNIGDRVTIRLTHEQLADPILSQADGMGGTITEVYQKIYDPEVDLYEIDLDSPIEGRGGERIVNLPGLYIDNLEREGNRIVHETKVVCFRDFMKLS